MIYRVGIMPAINAARTSGICKLQRQSRNWKVKKLL